MDLSDHLRPGHRRLGAHCYHSYPCMAVVADWVRRRSPLPHCSITRTTGEVAALTTATVHCHSLIAGGQVCWSPIDLIWLGSRGSEAFTFRCPIAQHLSC